MTNQTTSAIREVATIPMANRPLPAVVEQTALVVFARFSDRIKAKLNGRQERALELARCPNRHHQRQNHRLLLLSQQNFQK